MDTALLGGRALLALVFGVAGVAKLIDLAGTRQAVARFGVPARLAGSLGTLLPLAELVVAVALIPRATAWFGAAGALALLLAFIAGIAGNLARGNRPDCHCFGNLRSEPAGWSTLIRNAALAALALFVVAQGRDGAGPGVVGWSQERDAGELIAALAVAVLLVSLAVVAWLYRENRVLRARLAKLVAGAGETVGGLPIGATAPPFALADLDGVSQTLDELRAIGAPVLLLFVEPDCSACLALLPRVAGWQRDLGAELTVALISGGSVGANRKKVADLGLTRVLLQRDREVDDAYGVTGTPSALVVNADGAIGSEIANGGEAILELVTRAIGRPLGDAPATGENGYRTLPIPGAATATSAGALAPGLRLPDLNGSTIDLAAWRGRPALVVFWKPDCRFSQRMLPDLKAWEADPPAGAPRLLIVSTGSREANKAAGFRAPVVIDPTYVAPKLFGAHGTPSGVLIDARGRVASPVAVGRQAIMELATRGAGAGLPAS